MVEPLSYFDPRWNRAPSPAASNDDPLAAMIAEERDRDISFRIQQAPNAEAVSRANVLGRNLGLPAPVVDTDLSTFELQQNAEKMVSLGKEIGSFGRWASRPRNAEAAADDYDSLSLVGKGIYGLKTTGSYLVSSIPQVASGIYGAIGALAENMDLLTPQAPEEWQKRGVKTLPRLIADWSKGQQAEGQELASDWQPNVENWYARNLLQGVSSVGTTVAAVGVGAVAGPTAGASVMGASVGGNEYARAREQGIGPVRSAVYGVSQGAIETVTERIPVSRLLTDIANKSPIAKTFLRQLVAEIPGEQAATFLQDLNEWAVLNPTKTLSEFMTERPEAVAQTALATVGGVGTTVGVVTAADRTATVASKLAKRAIDARQAKENGAALDQIGEGSAASKLRQRDSDAYASLVREVAGDVGAEQVYIMAEAVQSYMQSDRYSGEMDDWRDRVEEGIATGGDVVFPTEEIVTRLAGTPAWDALKDDMRFDAGGMSRNEATTFEDQITDIMAEMSDRLAEQDRVIAELSEPSDRLTQAIADKLMNAGFTPNTARQQAELLSRREQTRASRMGRELTGGEFDTVDIRQVLPPSLAAIQKADQLDITIDVMKRQLDPKKAGSPSMLEFISRNGGIEDPGGDLRAMNADKWHLRETSTKQMVRSRTGKTFERTSTTIPGRGRLIRPPKAAQPALLGEAEGNSLTPDAWAERLWEAGYFPQHTERPTVNELLEAIDAELRGAGRYSEAQEASVRDAANELRAMLENAGIDADTASRSDIRNAVDRHVADRAEGDGYDQPSPIVTLSGEEIAPAGTPDTELRKAAKEWFKANLTGKTIESQALGGPVRFATARKPISSSADIRKLQLFAAIPDLIANAPEVDTQPARDGAPSVKAWHYLRGTVDLAGEALEVTLSVREDNNGNFYYNHVIESGAPSELTDPAREAGGGTEGSAYDQSVDQKTDNINLTVNSYADGPRGRITFPAAGFGTGPNIIELFESRDQSTFLHEIGHLWLEELRFDASGPSAPDQLKADWQAVEKWFSDNGHPIADGVIPVGAHELWARGVERYLMEGKAPTPTLRKLFQTFKSWLVSIYRSVDRLKSPISDEIRGVMDRLIATDEEIAAAAEQQNIEALFPEKPPTMTDAEFASYQRSTEGARTAAHDALLAKVMNGIRRRVTAEHREREADVRAEVTERVDARPEFRALRQMKDTPISTQWVKETYGEDATAMLPKQVPPIHRDNGANPDEVAELSGFTSGDEMVRTLMGVETRRRELREGGDQRSVRHALIDQETQAIMLERHGDPFTDGSIEEEALAAIHNDRQGEVIASELRVLARSTGQRITPYSIAKDWAARTVREGRVRDVASRSSIQRYQRAASKAGKAAMEAILKGDNAEAFRQKQAQMLNNALVSEAAKTADQVESAVARLEKWARRRTIKSVDQDYLERAQALLEQVDLKPRSQKFLDRQEGFAAWAEEQTAAGHDIAVPPSFAATLGTTNWSRLSVEQLLGLDDAVKQIIHLGRLKQTLIDNKEQREFEAVVSEAINGTNGIDKRPPSDLIEPSWWDAIKSRIASADAALLKMETVFDWLDQGNGNGVFNRIVFKPMADAQDRENAMSADYHGRIRDAFGKIEAKQLRRWSENFSDPSLPNPETGNPYQMKREQLVAIALNMGNEGNRQRLLDGYRWNEQAVMDALNRELTAKDWAFVQEVWDIIDTLWPEISAMERRVNGVEPDKVEATEFWAGTGPDAVKLRGGYYPAIYDSSKSYDAEANASKGRDLLEAGYTRATTRASSTKDRSKKVSRPILLQLGVINRHIGEVIHDITHREAVMQADKFLSDKRIMKVVDETMGPEIRQQFRPWLKYVANQWAIERAGNEGVGRFLQKLRSNTTIVGMGFRFTTMLTQIAGYANSFEFVGAKWVSAGIARTIASPIDTYRFVMEKSGEIRTRMDTLDRDIRLTLAEMQGKNNPVTAAKRFAFHGIGYMDRIVVIPTWIGAYNKAISQGMDEDQAIYAGDKAVRMSQGSGSAKDLAAVARGTGKYGEAFKLMTMFYSYMSAFYQRERSLGRDIAGVKSIGDFPALLARSFWLIVVPPILAQILSGHGPEDDEDWALWSFKQMLFQMLGPIPLVRDVVQPAWDKATGEKGFDYQFTPVQRGIQTAINTVGDAAEIAQGEETKRATRNAMETVGYFTGLIPGQLASSTQFLVDVGYGEQDPEGFSDWYEGLTKGRIQEE